MNHIHYLYKITNLTNQKIYIGQTVDPLGRWAKHKSDSKTTKKTKSVLHNALQKYGKDAFTFEVISCCKSQEDTDYTETELIKQYNSLTDDGRGYNITPGGFGSPKSNATKKKLSEYWTGNMTGFHSVEAIEKSAQSRTGRKASSEHREAISEGLKGHKQSKEHLEKLSKARKGKPKSEEWKRKHSEALKRRHSIKKKTLS